MNKFEAYKMDGLGNDFIIFDNRKKTVSLVGKMETCFFVNSRKNLNWISFVACVLVQ